MIQAGLFEIAAFPNSSVELEEIALEFSRGKPLDVEDLIKAVGRREVRELKETTQRTCAQNLAYWPWHLLSDRKRYATYGCGELSVAGGGEESMCPT